MTNDLEAFKREYVALCLKHGYEASGCGCCGSPWIDAANGNFLGEPFPDVPWPKEVVEAKLDRAVEEKSGTKLGEFKF